MYVYYCVCTLRDALRSLRCTKTFLDCCRSSPCRAEFLFRQTTKGLSEGKEMTTDAVSYLSTMPHKMSRDIRLSNDIGRDSNFDPFKKKDMTLMFGKPKERNSAQLMYFAEKPMRRPHGSVQMGKQSDPRKGGTVSQPKDTINQSAYTPKYTHQDCPKSVGFTQGLRFQTESYRDVVLEERKQVILTRRQPGDPAHPLIEGTAKDRSIANVKTHRPKPLVTRPDSSRANSIGKQAGRGWEHLRPKSTDRSLRYTTFPWEKNQRPASGLSGDPASGHPGEDGNRPSSALLGGTNADTSSINDTERPRAKSAAVAGGTEEEQEENWLKERKNLLVRCGLNGGGGVRLASRTRSTRRPPLGRCLPAQPRSPRSSLTGVSRRFERSVWPAEAPSRRRRQP